MWDNNFHSYHFLFFLGDGFFIFGRPFLTPLEGFFLVVLFAVVFFVGIFLSFSVPSTSLASFKSFSVFFASLSTNFYYLLNGLFFAFDGYEKSKVGKSA